MVTAFFVYGGFIAQGFFVRSVSIDGRFIWSCGYCFGCDGGV